MAVLDRFVLTTETMTVTFSLRKGDTRVTVTTSSIGRFPGGKPWVGPNITTMTLAEARAEYRRLLKVGYVPW